MRVLHATRVLNENLHLMRKAKEIDTRLAKGQQAIKQLRDLIPYYEKGLVKLSPSPQELVARIYMAERNITDKHIETLYNSAATQAKKTPSPETKSQYLSQVFGELEKYKTQLGKTNEIRWRRRLEKNRGRILLEIAKKDDGDGRRNKAVDQYIEALDMLRADDTGDPMHQNRIEQIKNRIRELGGQIPESWEASVKPGGDGLPAENDKKTA